MVDLLNNKLNDNVHNKKFGFVKNQCQYCLYRILHSSMLHFISQRKKTKHSETGLSADFAKYAQNWYYSNSPNGDKQPINVL